ncbi:MAG: ribonuclease H-like domain-containing protein [Planctomycetota bacterium]
MTTDRDAPQHLATLGALRADARDLHTAYAVLRQIREGRTRKQERFFDVVLADTTRTVRGKIWPDAAAMATAAELQRGTVVKALFHAEDYQGQLQLNVRNLREAADDDPDYDAETVVGAGYEAVRDVLFEHLVFDIETVPRVDKDALPPTVAASLGRHAERFDGDEAMVMGLSPHFGQVVSLAVGDGAVAPEDQQVTVFVVPPPTGLPDDLPDWMRPLSESDLLRAWWTMAAAAECVVSFNGRGFDVPFLIGRSLVLDVPARVDLLSNRYSLRPHLDLYRALTFGERALGPSNLDVVCWSLGIESPKETMDGAMVAPAYARGEIQKIAEYNAHDVRATTAVFHAVRDRILRFREDW